MKNFTGVIIEESLEKKDILQKVKILSTKIEPVTDEHQTPWLEKWTMHTVEIANDQMDEIAKETSQALESEHSWYADFKNDRFHCIIFRDKVFQIDRSRPEGYAAASDYGASLGIPDYQLDFSPQMEERIRNNQN